MSFRVFKGMMKILSFQPLGFSGFFLFGGLRAKRPVGNRAKPQKGKFIFRASNFQLLLSVSGRVICWNCWRYIGIPNQYSSISHHARIFQQTASLIFVPWSGHLLLHPSLSTSMSWDITSYTEVALGHPGIAAVAGSVLSSNGSPVIKISLFIPNPRLSSNQTLMPCIQADQQILYKDRSKWIPQSLYTALWVNKQGSENRYFQ